MKAVTHLIIVLLLLITPPPVSAQESSDPSASETVEPQVQKLEQKPKSAPALAPPIAPSTDSPTVREVVEFEARENALIEEAIAEQAAKGGATTDTPRATLISLAAALDSGDFEKAAEYLDLRYLPPGLGQEDGPELIKQLRYIFSRHIWVDIGSLSDEPEGWRDDGLPEYRDSMGSIETSNSVVELYIQRIPDGSGGKEWKISNASVALIPVLWQEFGHSEFAEQVSEWLPPGDPLGIDNWQWAYLVVFLLGLIAVVSLLSWLLARLARNSDAGWIRIVQHFLHGPLGIFAYIMLTRSFMLSLGLSMVARAIFDSKVLVHLAYVFLVVGIVEFLASRVRGNMKRTGRPEATAIVRPISVVIKMVLVFIVMIMGLDNAGYDVTTIIAGLGISSVAIALAAQKTLENLIGAITLYIARPVQPGDFCRFGDNVGTVEEIGLRSTSLRTLDRTLVVIPNASFAAGEIENFSARDSIRYHRMLGLRLATTPDQLRFILARLRELLYAHPAIISASISVRLFNINDYAYMVRLDSRVNSNDFQQYLAIAEDINLHIIDLVNESGSFFAYPSQTLMVEDAATLDSARQQQVETLVEQWRQQDKLPFPQWSDEYVDKIENTLEFPPRGSSANLRSTELGDEVGR